MTRETRNLYIQCIELTLGEWVMLGNVILNLPTWCIVITILCVIWVFLPDEIEIWVYPGMTTITILTIILIIRLFFI